MPFIEHDLKTLLADMPAPFVQSEVKTIMLQLLSAVEYCHANWIVSLVVLSDICINPPGDPVNYQSGVGYRGVVVVRWPAAPFRHRHRARHVPCDAMRA